MPLSGRRVVVTGAASGLGRTMAEAFVEAGADVVCADLPTSSIEDTVAELSSHPGSARAVEADVRSRTDVERMVDVAREAFDGVDVLVNNAGVRQLSFGPAHPAQDLADEMWERIVSTNLTGTFLCTKEALPGMLEAGEGTLIHLTTGLWPDGRARATAYCATKFGIEGFARSLALELEGTGVRSLLFEPGGAVDTGLVAHLDEAKRRERMDPSVVAEPAVRLAGGEGENGGRYVATQMRAEGGRG